MATKTNKELKFLYDLVELSNKLLKASSEVTDQNLSQLMDELHSRIGEYLRENNV